MNGGQPVNVDLSKYTQEKADGTMKIVNIEGKLHFVERKFDAKTGIATPNIVPIDIDSLKFAKKSLEEQLAGVTALLADAEGAKPV